MQITIFGASGRVGQVLTNLALMKGYSVVAFVHTNNPFKGNANLTVIKGSIGDEQAVRRALRGSSVAISTLGSWGTTDKNVLTVGMQTIIPVMESMKIKRLISLTGAGALWENDSPNLLTRINHFLLGKLGPKILSDGEQHLQLLETSSLDWTCLRAPVITKRRKQAYRLSLSLPPPWATVPREAVAVALLDQVTDHSYNKQAPAVY